MGEIIKGQTIYETAWLTFRERVKERETWTTISLRALMLTCLILAAEAHGQVMDKVLTETKERAEAKLNGD